MSSFLTVIGFNLNPIEQKIEDAKREAESLKRQAVEEAEARENKEGILGEVFTEEEIKEAFAVFDIDQDGYINAQEIRALLNVLNEGSEDEVIDEMIRMFDESGDGQVKWDEFYCKITGTVFGSF